MATATMEGLPTAERVAKAGGAFVLGGRRRGVRVYRMRDAPLERLYADGRISGLQYAAAHRYAWHWFYGSLAGALQSIDYDRVFAVDFSRMSGLARTSREAEHRDEYRRAVEAMDWTPRLVVEAVACAEMPLQQVGYLLGLHSAYRARRLALTLFCEGADALAELWRDD